VAHNDLLARLDDTIEIFIEAAERFIEVKTRPAPSLLDSLGKIGVYS